jgi:hypothetical protein
MNCLELSPVPITKQVLAELDRRNLVRLFKPTPLTQNPPPGQNIAEPLYVSGVEFGPHRLIAVGINQDRVRLGVHSDHEEFLIPDHDSAVRPVYLVIAYLSAAELRARDAAGALSVSDFICLDLYPCPRGAEMFTMLPGTVHCELTDSTAEGPFGCFYVTEPHGLDITWIDLAGTEFRMVPQV